MKYFSFKLKDLIFLLFSISSIAFVATVSPNYIFLSVIPIITFILSSFLNLKKFKKIIEFIPLFVFIISIALGFDLFFIITLLLSVTMCAKYVVSASNLDYFEIFLIGVMFSLISSVATISFTFGVVLIIFMFASFLFLISSQFSESEAKEFVEKRIFIASYVFSLILLIVLFYTLPRFSIGLVRGNQIFERKVSGFSHDVTIDSNPVNLDYQIVMRVEGKSNTSPLYIVGLRYSTFSNNHWLKSEEKVKIFKNLFNLFGYENSNKATIYLEPSGTDVVFQLRNTTGIYGNFNYLLLDKEKNLFFDAPYYKTVKYDVFYENTLRENLSESDLKRYLSTYGVSDKIVNLSKEITKNAKSTQEKINLIVNYLKQNNEYSLTPQATTIEDFILNKKSGYCEHFATAFVLLARGSGIPARLVSGFVTTEWNKTLNYYIVRAKDAHTWAEVYVDGFWKTVDPTPPIVTNQNPISMFLDSIRMFWYREVITYDFNSQFRLFESISSMFTNFSTFTFKIFNSISNLKYKILIFALILALLPITLLKKVRREDYLAILIIEMIGNDKKDYETILEFASRKNKKDMLEDVIKLYYQYKYGEKKYLKNTIIKKLKEIKQVKVKPWQMGLFLI